VSVKIEKDIGTAILKGVSKLERITYTIKPESTGPGSVNKGPYIIEREEKALSVNEELSSS
jgi:hypothetical protein